MSGWRSLEISGRFSGLASLCWVFNGCLICLTMFIYKSQAQVSGLCLSQHASPDVEKMILGNKCDANDKRQVSREQGEKVSAIASMYFDWGFSESKNCTDGCVHAAMVPQGCSSVEWLNIPQAVMAMLFPTGIKSRMCVKDSCQLFNRCTEALSRTSLKGC